MTLNELAQLSKMDIEKADRSELVSVEEVSIDPSMHAMQRMLAYINQVKIRIAFCAAIRLLKCAFHREMQTWERKSRATF